MLPSHKPIQHFLPYLPAFEADGHSVCKALSSSLALPGELLFYPQDFTPRPPSLKRLYFLCQKQSVVFSSICLLHNTDSIFPLNLRTRNVFCSSIYCQRTVVAQGKCSLNICWTSRQKEGRLTLSLDGIKTDRQSPSAGISIAFLQMNGLYNQNIKLPVPWMRYLGLLYQIIVYRFSLHHKQVIMDSFKFYETKDFWW